MAAQREQALGQEIGRVVVDDDRRNSASDPPAWLGRRRVLAVIPAFNEESTIAEVLEDARQCAPFADLVVVNDGSHDGTVARARAARVPLLDLPYNIGLGGAIQTAYHFAAAGGYQAVIQMDADGQHRAADVARLVEVLLRDQLDLVIGSRYLDPHGYRSTFLRRFGNRFFAVLLSALCRQRITDPTSGFRAVGPRLLHHFTRNYPFEYPEVESLLMAARLGCRIGEVAVQMQPRLSGDSTIGGWGAASYMVKVTLAIFIDLLRRRPTLRAGETARHV